MTPHPSATWSDDDKERIRDMWMKDGKSATEIAKEFPGKTRNAIIGVINRMGLSGMRKPRPKAEPKPKPETRVRVRVVAPAPPRVKAPSIAPPDCGAVPPLHIPFMGLGLHHCRFPLGEKPFTYCGHPIASGSYCAAHARLCYQPPSERRQKSADKNSLWHAQRAA